MERSPYWEAAKWTFCVVGGGAAATALVVGAYKATKRTLGKVFRTGPTEEKQGEKPTSEETNEK